MVDNSENETKLLLAARNGDTDGLQSILEMRTNNDDCVTVDLNCTGKHKAKGWTALHLSSYFGHVDVVKLLLENGVDVNCTNDLGDTALHRAAYTGRQDIVLLLLQNGVDVNLLNTEGHTAAQLSKTLAIRELIEAAEKTEQRLREETFLKAAYEGNESSLTEMMKSFRLLNINCTDNFGNTALHLAALRGRKSVVVVLLQAGVDTNLRNKRGQTACDMTSDNQMKMLLEVVSSQRMRNDIHRQEGLLFKRVRLLGWRPIWVVLERGVLSVFSSRADATTGSNRKWFKYLNDASVLVRTDATHLLTIKLVDGKLITFSAGNDPSSLVTHQKWENAIREHIMYCARLSGNVIDEDKDDELLSLMSLQDALKTAQAHQQVLEKQVNSSLLSSHISGGSECNDHTRGILSNIIESSKKASEALAQCLVLFIQQDQVRKMELEQEREKSRILQESLHVLAKEHLSLERSLSMGATLRPPSVLSVESQLHGANSSRVDADDEFYECESDGSMSDFSSVTSGAQHSDLNSTVATFNELLENNHQERKQSLSSDVKHVDLGTSVWGRRCRLPATMCERTFSVWSILKQCIGRELSKITMPVVFNEPLSFLQRMAEYMEYGELLKLAANCNDAIKRHELVTAFAVSATASNWERIGKPFNPLLGETYELDRYDDLGYRMVCEQVSHHPPVSAFHVESPDFTYHGGIEPKLKFWGKSVEVTPKGFVTLHLNRHQETYTWQYSNCCVHNIIVGKIWIEHTGVMEVVNHKNNCKSVVNFKSSGWFGKDIHRLEGFLYEKKQKVRAFYGKWTDAFYGCDAKLYDDCLAQLKMAPESNSVSQPQIENGVDAVDVSDETMSVDVDGVTPSQETTDLENDSMDQSRNLSSRDDERTSLDLCIPGQKLLWKANPKPSDTNLYYNFTLFAMMLNEIDCMQTSTLPPTDSRLRPDIRAMEDGDIDRAADEKNRLEEKQRSSRKSRGGDSTWKPRWFKQARNHHTGSTEWVFNHEYWTRNWFQCPDIF